MATASDHMMAVSHEEFTRLKTAMERIPASTILRVSVSWNSGDYHFIYGCGVCQGEYVRSVPGLVTRRPVHTDPKHGIGIYMHKDWCPRGEPSS